MTLKCYEVLNVTVWKLWKLFRESVFQIMLHQNFKKKKNQKPRIFKAPQELQKKYLESLHTSLKKIIATFYFLKPFLTIKSSQPSLLNTFSSQMQFQMSPLNIRKYLLRRLQSIGSCKEVYPLKFNCNQHLEQNG